MKIVDKKDNYIIYNGSILDMLTVIEPNSIDSIVCDPPYELGFMGKSWDKTGIAFQPDTWRKCYDALKDGGYLLAFGGSRTFHRMAVAIEDAGFEIRDTIMYLYGTGFPKSMNISKGIEAKETRGSANKTQFSELNGEKLDRGNWGITKNAKEYGFREKDYTFETDKNVRLGELKPTTDLAKQWQGWGSQLKPAYEPIIVARKPFKTSLVENVMINGVGGLNIDECRVPTSESDKYDIRHYTNEDCFVNNKPKLSEFQVKPKNDLGRFPANVIHDGSEEVISGFPDTKSGKMLPKHTRSTDGSPNGIYGKFDINHPLAETYGDEGSASRFFYCAKASKKDRDEGLEISSQKVNDGRKTEIDNPFQRGETLRKNIHPTVKPCELMQYLVRLVSPKNATILDPFMGSGSTGKAVMFENRERNTNYKFIGIELTEEYCHIASVRIDYALNKFEYDFKQELKEAEKTGQLSLF